MKLWNTIGSTGIPGSDHCSCLGGSKISHVIFLEIHDGGCIVSLNSNLCSEM